MLFIFPKSGISRLSRFSIFIVWVCISVVFYSSYCLRLLLDWVAGLSILNLIFSFFFSTLVMRKALMRTLARVDQIALCVVLVLLDHVIVEGGGCCHLQIVSGIWKVSVLSVADVVIAALCIHPMKVYSHSIRISVVWSLNRHRLALTFSNLTLRMVWTLRLSPVVDPEFCSCSCCLREVKAPSVLSFGNNWKGLFIPVCSCWLSFRLELRRTSERTTSGL